MIVVGYRPPPRALRLGTPPSPERARVRFEAAYLIGGGLLAATTLLLGYTGHRDAAVALGVAGAITGAVVGAARLASS